MRPGGSDRVIPSTAWMAPKDLRRSVGFDRRRGWDWRLRIDPRFDLTCHAMHTSMDVKTETPERDVVARRTAASIDITSTDPSDAAGGRHTSTDPRCGRGRASYRRGLSATRVATRAGVSRQAVYYHFGRLGELRAALAERGHAVPDEPEGTPRQRIVEAAVRVMSRPDGRDSFDAVADEAGVTRGALYHHFGDKRSLLIAVAERVIPSDAFPPSWRVPRANPIAIASSVCCASMRQSCSRAERSSVASDTCQVGAVAGRSARGRDHRPGRQRPLSLVPGAHDGRRSSGRCTRHSPFSC